MLSAGPMVPVQAVEAVLLSELQVSERNWYWFWMITITWVVRVSSS